MGGRPRIDQGTCSSKVCDKPAKVRGYCSGHYQKLLKGMDVDVPLGIRRTKAQMLADGHIPKSGLHMKARPPVSTHAAKLSVPTIKPMPDQQVAIDKLRKVRYRLVGDSMGVGKTVTGIGLDFAMREDDPETDDEPTLIICEKIGLDVWDWHLQAMGVKPEQIIVIDPTDRSTFEGELDNLKALQAPRDTGRDTDLLYFICHWDVIDRLEILKARTKARRPFIHWAHVIADEVHLAKNKDAKRTKALKKISASYKTGLSGTPADDKPQDLWSVLNWLYSKRWRSYWDFYDEVVQWVHSSQKWEWNEHIADGGTYDDFEPDAPPNGYRVAVGIIKEGVEKLHREWRDFYIRRTLLEVAPDMPRKVHVQPIAQVDMAPRQRREYEAMRDKALALIGALEDGSGGYALLAPAVIAVLTRLQQMSLATLAPEWDIKDDEFVDNDEDSEWDLPNIVLAKPSPKLDWVMNKIQTNEEEPFVIFTQFRGMADLVEEECQRLKIPVVKIHGGITSKDTRTRLVKEFQEGKARVFVGTIAAAGKTITLTRAAHVIFTDRSWNPSKNEQAEDRLWRRTQERTVFVHDVQSVDSIDQLRFDRINSKGQWIRELLNPPKRYGAS